MKDGAPIKYDYINSVRGIAILLVIVLHVSNKVNGLPDAFTYMCGKGAFGVQLFFVASAFTLFLSYSKRIKTEGNHTNRNFFIRRFFRISPMYYVAAMAYSIICFYMPAYNDGKPLEAWKVLANIMYLNGFMPGAVNYLPPGGWSVGVEMVFYCCLPFLFIKIKSFKSSLIWFVVITAASVLLKLCIRYALTLLSIDYHRPEKWFLYFWFPNQVPVFMLGIALFFAIQKYRIKNRLRVYTGIAASTVLLLIFMWFRAGIDTYNVIPEHTIVAVFFTINIFFLSQCTVKIFDNKMMRFLGEISFSLYLVHFIVVYVLADYCPLPANVYARYVVLLAVTLLISVFMSKLTYNFIELKGIAFGNNLIKRRALKPELNAGI